MAMCSLSVKIQLVFLLLLLTIHVKSTVSGTIVNEVRNSKVFYLLVIVSSSNQREDSIVCASDATSVPKWERGDEILLGARMAGKEMNDSFNFLSSEYQLMTIEMNILNCDINSVIVQYVRNLVRTKNIIGIVGYFCSNIANTFASLIQPNRRGYAVQISAALAYNNRNQSLTQHHTFPPLLTYAEALVSTLRRLGWSKVGVLKTKDYHDSYYSRLAETFIELIGSESIIYKNQVCDKRMNFTKLRISGVKILIGFLTPSHASHMICRAHREGLTWPNYVWILVDIEVDDLKPTNECNNTKLNLVVDKIIIMNRYPLFTAGDTVLPSGKTYKDYTDSEEQCNRKLNYYTNILYDLVWAFGIAFNLSLESINSSNGSSHDFEHGQDNKALVNVIEYELSYLSFQGTSGFVNFSQAAAIQTPYGIFQFQELDLVQLGLYETALRHLFLNISFIGDQIPSDELTRVYEIYPTVLTVGLSLLIVFCLLFTTLNLILFFCFREEPEIKASSRNLSLCMFLGCYTLLFASLDYTILSGMIIPQNVTVRALACVLDVTLSTIGLDLVLATLFAKTLRVYHIFKKFGKVSQLWSDNGLLILIFLIVLIKGVILIIWTSVDINHVIDVELYEPHTIPPHYRVIQKCHCTYFGMWYALTFLYTGTLFLALLLVAINTRKIKRTNFKDTKKVNLLIVTLIAVIIFSCTGWALLQFIDNNASKAIVSIAFTLTSVLCQSYLLVPKVIAPIVRYFKRKRRFIEAATISTDASGQL